MLSYNDILRTVAVFVFNIDFQHHSLRAVFFDGVEINGNKIARNPILLHNVWSISSIPFPSVRGLVVLKTRRVRTDNYILLAVRRRCFVIPNAHSVVSVLDVITTRREVGRCLCVVNCFVYDDDDSEKQTENVFSPWHTSAVRRCSRIRDVLRRAKGNAIHSVVAPR